MLRKSKLPNVGTTIFTVMSSLAGECGAINLSQGFPNFEPPAKLKSLVAYYLKQGKNQYAPMQGVPELRQVIAKKLKYFHGVDVDWESEITVTAGATQAIYSAITAILHPEDEAIIIEPAYDSYLPSIELCGAYPVPYSLHAPDYKVNWAELNRLFSRDTRMIIINNPHNPTGSVFTDADFQELIRITRGTDIMILSDEVYEHLIFDGVKPLSILSYPELRNRSIVTYSFGKTFHSTGWKLGYVVAPPVIMEEIRKVHQFNVFSVNTPMQYAVAEFMEDFGFFEELPNFYQKKRDFFLEQMNGSKLKPLHCGGTYFQLFDYSDISELPDLEFAKWLTREHGVATIPLSPFCSKNGNEKTVRVCFAKTDEVLTQAAQKLRAF